MHTCISSNKEKSNAYIYVRIEKKRLKVIITHKYIDNCR